MTDTRKSSLTLYDSTNVKKTQIKHNDTHVEFSTERTTPVTNGNVTISHASVVFKQPLGYDYGTSDGLAHLDNDVFATVRSNHAQILANKSTSDFGISSLNADLAAENVARIASDTTLTANLNAEVSRASGEEARIEAKLDQQITDHTADISQVNSSIASNVATLQVEIDSKTSTNLSLINAERVRALGIEQSLQSQITNVLSNTSPEAIDSLSELLDKMTADNLTLTNLINALDARLQTAESTISAHLAD